MRLSRTVTVGLAALVLACASAEKSGDKAAATGDWKTAERSYFAALQKDPNKPELKQKYAQARAAALDGAIRRANACWAARDVECAFAESDYVVNLDPGNAQMAVLRADASREAGLQRANRSLEILNGGDVRGALLMLISASEASRDPAVVSAVRGASPRVVGDAVAASDRLRSSAQYPAAIDLLSLSARVDPSVQGRLQAVQAEYERWKDAEAERLAMQGDQLLQQGRYAEAEGAYRSALGLRPQSRAQPLAKYAGAMARGLAAAEKRDFQGAERAFSEAANLRVDRGEAAAQLDRVKLRPYAVALRSVLVKPVRPDGWPWAGQRNRDLDRALSLITGRGVIPPGMVLDLARRIPRENQPVLVVTIALPDGRAVQSAPRRGAYALLDGSFTVVTNGFDDRAISMRVSHDDGAGAPVDAGSVTVRLSDLVSNREVVLAAGALVELRLEAVAADAPDGAVDRLQPIPDRDNLANDWSQPDQGARGFTLTAVEASAPPGTPGPLSVEVEQHGRVVYRNAPSGGPSARWTPRAVYLFARPDEQLLVRVLAGEGRNAKMFLSAPVTGRQLESNTARLNGTAGGGASLYVSPRHVGP